MKVVGISDTHGDLPKLPECDLVCIAGDIIPLNIQEDKIKSTAWFVKKFIPWANELNCHKVIFIAGNHDWLFYDLKNKGLISWEIEELLFLNETKISYLCDNFIQFKDKIIYGTPWCPDLKNWAFYGNHEKLNNKFRLIYPNCDLLITHCPPKIDECGVVLQSDMFNYRTDYGCQELRDTIDKLNPKWHIFGHVHSGSHDIVKFGCTNCVNVSLKDENYRVAYEPLVFDI